MGCCSSKQFEGQGQRLGSSNEPVSSRPVQTNSKENLPKPKYNPNINDSEREKIRAERAAAAEARANANQIGGKKKKKKVTTSSSSEPLRGPNSRNTMNWTAG
mmetsp:Transcript_5859/g.8592  ORF Transcript_5859/g.8592 Transcript_5859/m.8592 type:complete len:103 (+) Transcript_5859:146-454(+)